MPTGIVTVYGSCSRMWTREDTEPCKWFDERDRDAAREKAREVAGNRIKSAHATECGCDNLVLSAR